MSAIKKLKTIKTALDIVKSPEKALDKATRHNPKKKEIKKQLEITRETKRLKAKTKVIPETKEKLAQEKKSAENSREKTVKATDNNMGKGGSSSQTKKKVIKTATKGVLGLLRWNAGKEILSGDEVEKVSETTAEVLTDDAKLKVLNDSAEELEKLKADSSLIANLEGETKKEKRAALKEKIDKYREKQFGFGDMLSDTWQSTEFDKEGNKNGFLKRIGLSFMRFFTNFSFYIGVKKAEKKGLFTKYEELKASSDELKRKGKEVGESLNKAKKIKRLTKTTGVIPAKKILKNFNQEHRDLFHKYFKIDSKTGKPVIKKGMSIKEFAEASEDAYKAMFKNVNESGQQKKFLKLVKGSKVPGVNFNAGGAMGVAGAINISLYKAIDEGSFRTFGQSLISKDTLTEAFVPGVGTWRSIKRTLASPDQPLWFKATDIGLNVVGDAMLTAGYISSIFSFGGGAVAGIAGRTAVVGLGKRLLTKQGLKIMAKKVASKEALKVAGNSVKKGAKASLITAPITAGIQIAFKKFFNKDAVEKSFRENILTDEQRRSLEITERMEDDLRAAT